METTEAFSANEFEKCENKMMYLLFSHSALLSTNCNKQEISPDFFAAITNFAIQHTAQEETNARQSRGLILRLINHSVKTPDQAEMVLNATHQSISKILDSKYEKSLGPKEWNSLSTALNVVSLMARNHPAEAAQSSLPFILQKMTLIWDEHHDLGKETRRLIKVIPSLQNTSSQYLHTGNAALNYIN